jgi:AraC-like DNA-binding protein
MPTIEQVAFMGSHNTRSLQRALSQHGVSYTDLVNKMKAEAAQHLLLQDNTSVANVAQLLKYQHSSHFIRAFKKEIDMTPKQYQLNNEEHTK